ncbi:dephospho-CoA kinase [Gilvimarinus xylanilyticus]|uniref:Dephospho-CoA kinase n=1 Tax=Gilvimarinus xylanilyticus TaxID=2944139 RepID=A0A9X2I4J6_9GAMM|nr:dephospho-CoA kinase [Gilvimarinus xylanilyticus]MCP8900230.1 dephospho-CoA kinase [Gilvimarinus xylanilyticus]
MPIIIGLTGGIGSGKSAAADLFAARGINIVDADIAAREVVEPGTVALQAIAEHFGPDILLADASLDRRALREIIFTHADEKKWLETLLHPAIRTLIKQQLNEASSAYTILVSPLLLETDQHTLVDRLLVIDCPEADQIQRAAARDQSGPERIKAIMANQLSRDARLAKADDILHNHASLADLETQVETLHQTYLSLAQRD